MAKLESWYKNKMVSDVQAAGGYARRLEDQYGVGILDMVFKIPGMPMVLAEAKRFSYQQFELSPRQWEEARRIVVAGGIVASIGVKIPEEVIHIYGLPKARDGKVRASECVIAVPGESFVDTMKRWYGETYVSNR